MNACPIAALCDCCGSLVRPVIVGRTAVERGVRRTVDGLSSRLAVATCPFEAVGAGPLNDSSIARCGLLSVISEGGADERGAECGGLLTIESNRPAALVGVHAAISRMRILDKGVGSVPDFADLVPDFAELQLNPSCRNRLNRHRSRRNVAYVPFYTHRTKAPGRLDWIVCGGLGCVRGPIGSVSGGLPWDCTGPGSVSGWKASGRGGPECRLPRSSVVGLPSTRWWPASDHDRIGLNPEGPGCPKNQRSSACPAD